MAELLESVVPDCATDISFNQWHSYGNAVLARRTGQVNDAVNILERLLTQDVEVELKGRIYTTLGRSHDFLGQWDVALKNYQLALQFHQTHQDVLHQGIALNNMGSLYRRGKEYEQAIQCLLRAEHLLYQFPTNKEYQVTVGYTYTILAGVHLEKGDFLRAEHNYLKALEIAVEHNNSWGIPFAHVNLGETYYNLKQYQQAEHHYQEAINRFLASENERSLAYTFWRMGQIATLTDQKKASTYFTKALRLATKNNRHELIVDILLDQAKLLKHQGDEEEAFTKVKRAQGYAESLRAHITLADDRARMTAMLITAYEQMVQYLLARGQIAEAFYYAEMGKSRTFIETLEQQNKMQTSEIPQAWLEEEQQVRQKLTVLHREREANDVKIRQLETSLHQIREHIRLQSATSQAFHTVTPLALEQVQARLPLDAVLVEYIAIEDELWCFVITTNTVAVHHLSLTASMLQKAFKTTGKEGELGSLHNLTRSPDYRLRPAWMLKKLYSLLIEPLGEQVESAPLLCLVPHGLLHYVPFHALYKQTSNGLHYLDTANRQIIYASSATVLLDYCQMTRNIKGKDCLALGFNGTLLRQAEAEAHAIADLMGGTAITGVQATRQHVLDVAHQYRYLHFSCHGWFNSIWPMASSLELADQPLDISDILRTLHLQAELVCLSACETGRSYMLKGDELTGLAHAFMRAGTSSILVSYWVVDELSTRLFMELFYQNLLICQQETTIAPTALALSRTMTQIREMPFTQLRDLVEAREPQRADEMLQFWADSLQLGHIEQFNGSERLLDHPYYWAPFFLIGDNFDIA